MENYAMINGKWVLLSNEQIRQIQESVKLSAVSAGDTCWICNREFVVLEHLEDGSTALILKDLLHKEMEFGRNNCFKKSNVDKACADFAKELAEEVGENLLEHTVDLTADDGLKDYGTMTRYASLLTTDLYRRYVEILDKYKPDRWWWLATPCSTKTHENDRWVKGVAPSGCVGDGSCGSYGGVRPFLIFKSSISVSV